jgi:hypothetical protein
MVVFDTSCILLTLDPKTRPPIDPKTGVALTNYKKRVDFLIQRLGNAKEEIVIPTPVLSEFLVGAGQNRHEYIEKFISSRHFTIAEFDMLAAIELALLNDPDLNSQKRLNDTLTKAKIRFDRQVISIAKVRGAKTIYAGDGPLADCARDNGIQAIMTWELPEPPEDKQVSMFDEEDPATRA